MGVQGVRHRLHAGDAHRHLMVSPEGACAAYYNFGRMHREAAEMVGQDGGRVTPEMIMTVPPGHRLFAKYTHAPNSLGYCGPAGEDALRAVAAGGGKHVDVPLLARGFSGAWPYQEVLAELTGIDDPLDERVVRAYWTGNELTDTVGNVRFGAALLERIRPQADHYWGHLNDDLLTEAAPTHQFHVFGIYPWSRFSRRVSPSR